MPHSGIATQPQVELVRSFSEPFSTILTAARTCYSGKGPIRDEDLKPGNAALAEELYEAGHHTTIQHAHFLFIIDKVSRQFLWSFLHAHPFYNSEQVSQRYVTVKPGEFYYRPELTQETAPIYDGSCQRQLQDYQRLTELLLPVTQAEYLSRFPGRKNSPQSGKEAQKKSQEIARYLLPVATFAYLYHSISALTLLRYHRLCNQYDTPDETRAVVAAMVAAVIAQDARYGALLHEPIPIEQTPEHLHFLAVHGAEAKRAGWFRREFDAKLGGKWAALVNYGNNNEAVLAQAVREVLGVPRAQLEDGAAIKLALDPAQNPLLGDALNLTTHSKLSRALVHPHYSFAKKLSHAADSQDQRHRMTPASRGLLAAHVDDEPDYIMPEIVRQVPEAEALYIESMERSWEAAKKMKSLGAPEPDAHYLLPNALTVRFTESTDLLNLHHKHKMRLCYNAQEEIWRASLDEAEAVSAVNPRIGAYLQPPCWHRQAAAVTPYCPEGVRYCGVPVWKLERKNYVRVI